MEHFKDILMWSVNLAQNEDSFFSWLKQVGVSTEVTSVLGIAWNVFTVVWTFLVLVFLILLNRKIQAIAWKSIEATTLSKFITMKTSWEGFTYSNREAYDQELHDRFSQQELEALFKFHHIYKRNDRYTVFNTSSSSSTSKKESIDWKWSTVK